MHAYSITLAAWTIPRHVTAIRLPTPILSSAIYLPYTLVLEKTNSLTLLANGNEGILSQGDTRTLFKLNVFEPFHELIVGLDSLYRH